MPFAWTGAAIECRLGAEDPDNQFFPSPGLITTLEMPSGPGIRLDSGIYPGWTVPIEYDSLLGEARGLGAHTKRSHFADAARARGVSHRRDQE